MVDLIWATRGRSWGFRFLLDGGDPDPLSSYERAFLGAEAETALCRRSGGRVVLRFPDPNNRTDAAGRVISHDFVIAGPLASTVRSVNDGLREIWPLVAGIYAETWDSATPPSPAEVRRAVAAGRL